MSRIGKQPIEIPSGITVELKDNEVVVKSSKGELRQKLHELVKVTINDNEIIVERANDSKEARSMHGLFRSLISNMVEGLDKGFSKQLEIQGVGYRANLQGKKLVLSLGFSHPIEFTAPEGVEIKIDEEKKNIITVSGYDKQLVGHVAAKIRSYRKPEPYKGKGIRYVGEHIIRKAGKAAAAAAGE